MASGGMEWAYRIAQREKLDPLGLAIILHLGWRDAPNQRTDRGIAAALGQHRASVQRATARLAALGLIARRSGCWVAVETIAIVEQSAEAPRPDARHADGKKAAAYSGGRPTQAATPGLLRRPQVAYSGGHKRKENIEKRAQQARGAASRAAPAERPARPAAPERPEAKGAGGDGRPAQTQAERAALAASLGLPVFDANAGGWKRPHGLIAEKTNGEGARAKRSEAGAGL